MSELPTHLKYANSHEWIQTEEENTIRIGITDFAQQSLGDIVFIQLPEVGTKLSLKQQCAVVESVKTASDLFSPVNGTVSSVNTAVAEQPELVNEAPYQNWLFCIKADDMAELDTLMDAAEYQTMIDQ